MNGGTPSPVLPLAQGSFLFASMRRPLGEDVRFSAERLKHTWASLNEEFVSQCRCGYTRSRVDCPATPFPSRSEDHQSAANVMASSYPSGASIPNVPMAARTTTPATAGVPSQTERLEPLRIRVRAVQAQADHRTRRRPPPTDGRQSPLTGREDRPAGRARGRYHPLASAHEAGAGRFGRAGNGAGTPPYASANAEARARREHRGADCRRLPTRSSSSS